MARLFVLLGATLLAACSAATGDKQAPAPNGRVRDFAGILDPAVEARLAERLDKAERLYGPQVGIVTVASLDGRTIEDYSVEYARRWGLGDRQRDDGLMILVAPRDHRARIQVGYGLEGSFTDVFCKEIIDKTMLPQFRQANFGRGLEGAVDMIISKMRAVPSLPANDNHPVQASEAA